MRDNKRSGSGLDNENTLHERPEQEGAADQNAHFLFRSPEIHDKRALGKRDEVGLGDNSNPAIVAAILSYHEGTPATRYLIKIMITLI